MAAVTFVIVVLFLRTYVEGAEICLNGSIFPFYHIFVNDSTEIASTIFTFDDQLKGLLSFSDSSPSECKTYLELNGIEVKLIKSLRDECSITSVKCTCYCGVTPQEFRVSIVKAASGEIQFRLPNYTITVLENSTPKELYKFAGEINRTDCTFEESGYLEIKNNDTGPFAVVPGTSIGLIDGHQLDYDAGRHFYTIQITYNETTTFRTASTNLIVHVKDVDDMDPVFQNSSYTYKVFENTIDTDWKVTDPEIAAYDRDLGEGRQNLSFFFIDDVSTKDGFSINKYTGKIKTLNELDRETRTNYKYKLKVVQDNNHLRSATVDLTIVVQDKNDNLPSFENKLYKANIDEHSSVGMFLCRVSAIDKDESPFDNTTYKLENYNELLDIVSDKDMSGIITVKNSEKLDRETLGDVINLQIVAIDATNQTEGGNTTVEINIRDINDNSPVFTQKGYTFIPRNFDEVVGQVKATDADIISNGNGVVLYSISHSLSIPVHINETTGELSLVHALADDIEFYVEACDNPVQQSSRRCSQVLVDLRVNSTDITDVILYANVSENVAIGTIVTLINIKGTYYKVVDNSSSFAVGESSGLVSTLEMFDREKGQSEFAVNIHILTKTYNVFVNITLLITVLDVNDNSPVYNKLDYFFELPEIILKGHIIGKVQANDDDIWENSDIQYLLAYSIVSKYFSVNVTSGDLMIGTSDLPLEKELFHLIIVATDKGTPPLKSSCNIYVSKTAVDKGFVRISTPTELSTLQKEQQYYEEKIGKVLQLKIKIEEIRAFSENTRRRKRSTLQPSLYATRSFIYISAQNLTGTVVPNDDLQKIILQHMEGIQALFMQQSAPITSEDASLSASSIALIVMAAVILVGGVIAIYIIFKTKTSKKRNSSMSSIEEEKDPSKDKISLQSIEVAVTLDEETERTSDYEGSHNSNEHISSEDNKEGVTNPVYRRQSETVSLENVDIEKMTTDQAVEHLNRLNEVLNQEDAETPLPDYEIVDTLEVLPGSNVQNSGTSSIKTKGDIHEKKHNTYINTADFDIETPEADYENTASENDTTKSKYKELDEESGEFIASNNDLSESDNQVKNSEEPAAISEDEPDVDYNDKQVRFSAVVLDTEENKFEPIKLDNEMKNKTIGETDEPSSEKQRDNEEINNEISSSGFVSDQGVIIEEITSL